MLLGCQKEEGPVPDKVTPERKTEIMRTAIEWLECEECEDGELEAVKKEGEMIVPTLAAALERGPSGASLEILRLQLEKRYDKLVTYSKTHPNVKMSQSKKEFVSHYMDNYIALYHIRAIMGLSAIGGNDASAAISKAKNGKYRDDVRKVLAENLQE